MNHQAESIVFDQFQRYGFILKVLEGLALEDGERILEVGAAFSPLHKFLSGAKPILVDSASGVSCIDVRASGLKLPFPDQAFRVVVSTDALEHVQFKDRPEFLRELQRVTSDVLVLGFPFRSEHNMKADRIFCEFVKQTSRVDPTYLREHDFYGLPVEDEVIAHLKGSMSEILVHRNSNVYSWLLLQLGNFVLLQRPELEGVRSMMNAFFNTSLESTSHNAPCYRTFLVCSRRSLPDSLKEKMKELCEVPTAGQAEEYAAVCFALIQNYEGMIRQKDDEMAKQDAHVHDLNEERLRLSSTIDTLEQKSVELEDRELLLQSSIRLLRASNQELRNYLELFLQHPVYKVYKSVKNFLSRFSKTSPVVKCEDPIYKAFRDTFDLTPEELKEQSLGWQNWQFKPSLNLVTSVFSPPIEIFREAVASVVGQTYGNWIWTIVDASADELIWREIQALADQDPRIRPFRLSKNQGISENINYALRQAQGDYIVMFDHDDRIAFDALYEVAETIRKHPDTDFIYSDSDMLDEMGRRCEPLFKPDFSPEMMLCCNLLNQISVFRRNLLDKVGYLNPLLDGAQDWDLYLRILQVTSRIRHIPRILYHWRKTSQSCAQRIENKPYARSAQRRTIMQHLVRSGIKAPTVKFDFENPIQAAHPMSRWVATKAHKISVIIPTTDQAAMLGLCLEGIYRTNCSSNLQVVVVDTGSKEEGTLDLYRKYACEANFKVVHNPPPFNFSRACNEGVRHSDGSLFLFMNNDIEIVHTEWLERMVQWFDFSEIGVVGPKLVYPDGRIQHAGVIVGMGGMAGHLFLGEPENTSAIFGSDGWYRNLSAVTGACMLVRREAFERCGGFDESFQLNFSDVDLCLRIRKEGYRIVYTPDARLIHHESATHKRKIPKSDFQLANEKFASWWAKGDPYFNPNLNYRSPIPLFRLHQDDSCWNTNQVLIKNLPDAESVTLPLIYPQNERSSPVGEQG